MSDDLLKRRRGDPQYHERISRLRASLTERHVSPTIIERVERLNPRLVDGEILRGIHYSGDNMILRCDCVTKGAFIRRYGREAWGRVDTSGIVKCGRRKYVKLLAAREAIAA